MENLTAGRKQLEEKKSDPHIKKKSQEMLSMWLIISKSLGQVQPS